MTWREILWLLVQPIERGGLGMPPSEAKQLTPEEAMFYLNDRKTIKAIDREYIQARSPKLSPEEKKRVAADYLKQLRKHYTGSEDL